MTGDTLRQARERAHMSQADLSLLLRVSTRTIQVWESQPTVTPYPRHRAALARFLEEHGERAAA